MPRIILKYVAKDRNAYLRLAIAKLLLENPRYGIFEFRVIATTVNAEFFGCHSQSAVRSRASYYMQQHIATSRQTAGSSVVYVQQWKNIAGLKPNLQSKYPAHFRLRVSQLFYGLTYLLLMAY